MIAEALQRGQGSQRQSGGLGKRQRRGRDGYQILLDQHQFGVAPAGIDLHGGAHANSVRTRLASAVATSTVAPLAAVARTAGVASRLAARPARPQVTVAG